MSLQPKLPPGRANRKALSFSVDIRRLRDAGYTFSAIQMALLEAGVEVSLTTIKREAARRGPNPTVHRWYGSEENLPSDPPTVAGVPAASSPLPQGGTGREVAEAFFNANPSNPLLPPKVTT